MIRRIISLLALIAALTAPVASYAQNRVSFSGAYNALDFAYGVVPGSAPLLVTAGSNTSGTYTVTVAFGNTTTTSGLTFAPIATTAPLTIGGGSSMETVTPSSVSCSTPGTQYTCQFTATFTNAHNNGDTVRSGDFGMQEAAAYAVAHGGGLIVLSPQFLQAAGLTTNANVTTYVTGFKSLSASTTVLNYSGIAGALSYAAAAASNYASTTHVIY